MNVKLIITWLVWVASHDCQALSCVNLRLLIWHVGQHNHIMKHEKLIFSRIYIYSDVALYRDSDRTQDQIRRVIGKQRVRMFTRRVTLQGWDLHTSFASFAYGGGHWRTEMENPCSPNETSSPVQSNRLRKMKQPCVLSRPCFILWIYHHKNTLSFKNVQSRY